MTYEKYTGREAFVSLAEEPYLHQTDVEFCEDLARKVGVGAVPGTSFFSEKGVNNIIRLHFAKLDSTLNEALERLSHIREKML